MHEIIISILPEIEYKVKQFDIDRDSQKDLVQTLILKCYENEKNCLKMHEQGKLLSWIFVTARNEVNYSRRKKKLLPLSVDIQDELAQVSYPNIKPMDQMIGELNEIDRMWITTYLECKMKYLEVSRRTGIDRTCVRKRIEHILEKWKHLDIYLSH